MTKKESLTFFEKQKKKEKSKSKFLWDNVIDQIYLINYGCDNKCVRDHVTATNYTKNQSGMLGMLGIACVDGTIDDRLEFNVLYGL